MNNGGGGILTSIYGSIENEVKDDLESKFRRMRHKQGLRLSSQT